MPDTRARTDLRVAADETAPDSPTPPVVDIVIPVYNEAAVVEASVARLYDYLQAEFPFTWRVTIVDNASTDGTWFRAARLARDADSVRAVHLDEKGRGRALRRAWSTSDAAVVAYMDVDLSTDLDALLPLIAPLVSGHSDVAIGSRLTTGASVARRPKRELISRTYNTILHAVFATGVSDAQCGFKALRADVARGLLPAVRDNGWFFDTELLLLAEHNGLRIHEVPVDWIDDTDSRVHVARTALGDLAGTARMAWTFLRGHGRVDLGDAARPHLTDDFGRGIVSLGVVTATGAGVAAVSFFVLTGAVGSTWATVAAVAAGATVVGRRLALLRTASRSGVDPMIVDELTPEVVDRPSGSRFEACDELAPGGRPSRLRQLIRGPESSPVWERPALLALLGATVVLYLWGLGASGWANTYYSAAVQAGTKSWKAFFFGSLDAGNSITVDKTPGFLWVMELSARVFGVNVWSILVPQAIEGVAAVGVLYATVRRWFSPAAALLAGLVMATTPVAALMFRFNNPDALLVLLLTGAAYALTRALEKGSTRWLVLAFSLVGFGFLAKMLQALIVLPVFGLVYLFVGPPKLGRRIRQLALGGIAMIVSAGWWIAIVQLTPASSRPYIGGSQTNSLFNLMFGYNGFGRLSGNETGSVGGGGTAGGMWGATGATRLFNSEFGGQISWLLPAALLLLIGGLVVTARRPRTDRTRAALLLWGGWLVLTALLFSFGKGIIHPYYTIALSPAVGAVVGIGATTLWAQRSMLAKYTVAVVLAVSVVWSYTLLARTPAWNPWLRVALAIGGAVVVVALFAWPFLPRRSGPIVAIAAVAVALLGPGAYAVATAATPHTGAIPSAGPAVANRGGPGGLGGGAARRVFAGGAQGTPPAGFGGGAPPGGFTGGGFNGPPTGAPTNGTAIGGTANGLPTGGNANRGGIGGLLNGTTVSSALKSALLANHSQYTWVAAAVSANNAGSYQLATGAPVMAIGGFNGTDPSPTLAEFQALVAEHKVHYFIASGGGFGGGGVGGQTSSASSAISTWVSSHFTAKTVGGVTLYDLTQAASS